MMVYKGLLYGIDGHHARSGYEANVLCVHRALENVGTGGGNGSRRFMHLLAAIVWTVRHVLGGLSILEGFTMMLW